MRPPKAAVPNLGYAYPLGVRNDLVGGTPKIFGNGVLYFFAIRYVRGG